MLPAGPRAPGMPGNPGCPLAPVAPVIPTPGIPGEPGNPIAPVPPGIPGNPGCPLAPTGPTFPEVCKWHKFNHPVCVTVKSTLKDISFCPFNYLHDITSILRRPVIADYEVVERKIQT